MSRSALLRVNAQSPRDVSIDTIKGLACLMMVLVHSFSDARGMLLLRAAMEVGDIAPALFLAVTGMLAAKQTKRKSIRTICVFYTVFFLFGVSFNILLGQGPSRIFKSDILQLHAIAVIIIAALHRWRSMTSNHLIVLAIGCFLVNLALWPLLPSLPGLQYVAWVRGGDAIYPIFPWMAAPLLGMAADRFSPRKNVILGLVAFTLVLCCAVVKLWIWDIRFLHKSNMSIPYFFMVCTVIFLGIGLCRASRIVSRVPLVVYFGTNSLLFFYVHYALVFVLRGTGIPQTPVFWVMLVICTYVVMRAMMWLGTRSEGAFRRWQLWVLLFSLIITTPFVCEEWRTVVLVEALSGSLFAIHYPQLKKMIESLSEKESGSMQCRLSSVRQRAM